MSAAEALQVPKIFRERCCEVRRRMLAGELNPAAALLELGMEYLVCEQMVVWGLSVAPPAWRRDIELAADEFRALARSLVGNFPDLH